MTEFHMKVNDGYVVSVKTLDDKIELSVGLGKVTMSSTLAGILGLVLSNAATETGGHELVSEGEMSRGKS